MFKPLAVCCYLGLFAAATLAHAGKDPVDSEKPVGADGANAPAHVTDAKQRRAALRAALKPPTDASIQPHMTPDTVRQLNAQERAQLRQQLLLQQQRSSH